MQKPRLHYLPVPEDLNFPFRICPEHGPEQFDQKQEAWVALTGYRKPDGYFSVSWRSKDRGRIFSFLHRVIWELHNGPVPDGLEIDHIDADKSNNRIDNLQLLTRKENLRKARAQNPESYGYRKLSKETREWLIGAYPRCDWNGLAEHYGVHRVSLLNVRAQGGASKRGPENWDVPPPPNQFGEPFIGPWR